MAIIEKSLAFAAILAKNNAISREEKAAIQLRREIFKELREARIANPVEHVWSLYNGLPKNVLARLISERVEITAERLRRLLHYDQNTGIFTWKEHYAKNVVIGSPAGFVDGRGYVRLCIDQREYQVHRLAFLYVNGEWPTQQLDHINQIKHDNRMCNLREVSPEENSQNQRRAHGRNKSGVLGVTTVGKRFRANIWVGGVRHNLGNYASAEQAGNAYIEAKRRLHEGCTI